MGWEVIGMLGGNVSLVTGQNVQPAYPGPGLGGSDKAFLLNVVTPIYEVVRKVSIVMPSHLLALLPSPSFL
jgi:callose synthase